VGELGGTINGHHLGHEISIVLTYAGVVLFLGLPLRSVEPAPAI
jgi:hypothetical protein